MIAPNTRWTHIREGYEVLIVALDNSSNAKVKDANDAQWQQAIGYRRYDEGDNDAPLGSCVYVRAEADFRAKFQDLMHDEGDAL